MRAGIKVEEAAQVAWAIASPHQYEYLVIDCGWSIERYRAHLEDPITARLLVPETPTPRRGDRRGGRSG